MGLSALLFPGAGDAVKAALVLLLLLICEEWSFWSTSIKHVFKENVYYADY
jgi:hypothetical protein